MITMGNGDVEGWVFYLIWMSSFLAWLLLTLTLWFDTPVCSHPYLTWSDSVLTACEAQLSWIELQPSRLAILCNLKALPLCPRGVLWESWSQLVPGAGYTRNMVVRPCDLADCISLCSHGVLILSDTCLSGPKSNTSRPLWYSWNMADWDIKQHSFTVFMKFDIQQYSLQYEYII